MITLLTSVSVTGFGLLFFGQNYLLYPFEFPPGSRTGAFQRSPRATVFWTPVAEVPVPTDFDLPYQDPHLTTPDGVKLKCFLLTQRKELLKHGAKLIHSPEDETDEEVRSFLYESIHFPVYC